MDNFNSPLFKKIKTDERLTLDNLAELTPIVQAGAEADDFLKTVDKASLDNLEYRKLKETVRLGDETRERLIIMGLPLIRSIAHNSYNQRKAWASRVSYEDILQEAIFGFIRGVNRYKPSAQNKSATNYLGQWITTSIQRNIETLDHDFTIPHETMERFRKIRAIRGALYNQLGRQATDDEVLEYDNNNEWVNNNKLGRVKKSDKKPIRDNDLTQKHLNEEKRYSQSTGALDTIMLQDDSDNEYERPATPLSNDDESSYSTTHQVDEDITSKALRNLFELVFEEMTLGDLQETVIRKKFGMKPYGTETTLEQIAEDTKLTKYKINQILTAFSSEMSAKGSAFHYVVSNMNNDELDAVNMGWIPNVLGGWESKARKNPPPLLTNVIKTNNSKPKTNFGEAGRDVRGKYLASFHCASENITHKHRYIMERNIPVSLECPSCKATAYKI